MNENVRLQNLRDFTVQIRHPASGAIVGTGVVVSPEGLIVTCTHVVRAAGLDPLDRVGQVSVYFPQVPLPRKNRLATVQAYSAQPAEDLALLKLTGGPAPLAEEQIAVLGAADESAGHAFRSYGYRRLDAYCAGLAIGTIMGTVEPPEASELSADPIQLESSQINCGMSGAAVLDTQCNLVVGIISEVWFPDRTGKDRDTAWALNARALGLAPFCLPLWEQPYWLTLSPPPVETGAPPARVPLSPAWNNAPEPLAEWAGREELLAAISADWNDPAARITGLIGFGGEGKSSLARFWLKRLLEDSAQLQPDGIFWWSFDAAQNVDQFFQHLLVFLLGKGGAESAPPPGENTLEQIAGLLNRGRYIFVLDGLEGQQFQSGDGYGLFENSALGEFLKRLAGPGQRSFCLLTSRLPVLDLLAYATYRHHAVRRLALADGCAVLRRLGVKGEDRALERIVEEWDGHALTLSLIAVYLVGEHGGEAAYAGEIPAPVTGQPVYERVHHLLRWYNRYLSEAERAFLILFSAFRTPVDENAIAMIFRARPRPEPSIGGENFTDFSAIRDSLPKASMPAKPIILASPPKSVGLPKPPEPTRPQAASSPLPALIFDLNRPIVRLDESAFEALLRHLREARILRCHYAMSASGAGLFGGWESIGKVGVRDEIKEEYWPGYSRFYTAHPLIRAYYAEQFERQERLHRKAAQQAIAAYYLFVNIEGDGRYGIPYNPTQAYLEPYIDAVYYLCRAGAWNRAYEVLSKDINQKGMRPLANQYAAWDVYLKILAGFFPGGDFSLEPQVSGRFEKGDILFETANSLHGLGRLYEAAPLYERSISMSERSFYWACAAERCTALLILYQHLGALNSAAQTAPKALDLARHSQNGHSLTKALCAWAYTAFLSGSLPAARAAFEKAAQVSQTEAAKDEAVRSDPGAVGRDPADAGTAHWGSANDAWYAMFLLRTGEAARAHRIAESQLKQIDRRIGRNNPRPHIAVFRRILGEAEAGLGQAEKAANNFDEAVRAARGLADRAILIEALLARGRWLARQGQARTAGRDLSEALEAALTGGYRVAEVDIRVGLAWLHSKSGQPLAALAEAERALRLSMEAGYFWGQGDAAEVLAGLGRGTGPGPRPQNNGLENFPGLLDLGPDDPWQILFQAQLFKNQQHYSEAAGECSRVLAADPDNREALFLRGTVNYFSGEYASARADLDRVIGLDPNDAEGFFLRALTHCSCKEYDLALADLDRAIALEPSHPRALFWRGAVYLDTEQYDQALADLNQILDLDPDDGGARFLRGCAYHSLARYAEALSDFDCALQLKPDDSRARIHRGDTEMQMQQYERARADYEIAVRQDPENVYVFVKLSQVYYCLQRYAEGLAASDRGLAIDPQHIGVLAIRGLILFKLRQYEPALSTYDQIVGQAPENALSVGNRGTILMSMRRWDAALADLSRAIQLDPGLELFQYNRALIYQLQGRAAEAQTDLAAARRTAQSRYSEAPHSHVDLMYLVLYCLAAGEAEPAGRYCQELIDLHASVYLIRQAVDELNEYLDLFPANAAAQRLRDQLQDAQRSL